MAADYHDPTLKQRTAGLLRSLGITVSESEPEDEPVSFDKPLREPPVQIQTVRPQRQSLTIGWPERIDVSALGLTCLAVAFVLILLFWAFSTFPLSAKLLGVAGCFAALGGGFFGLAYWIHRGGHHG